MKNADTNAPLIDDGLLPYGSVTRMPMTVMLQMCLQADEASSGFGRIRSRHPRFRISFPVS